MSIWTDALEYGKRSPWRTVRTRFVRIPEFAGELRARSDRNRGVFIPRARPGDVEVCAFYRYTTVPFSHRTRRDYGYGWDPYVDDFCIFIVRARGFFFYVRGKCPRPSTACQVQRIRRCFGDHRRSVFFTIL